MQYQISSVFNITCQVRKKLEPEETEMGGKKKLQKEINEET